MNQLDLRIHQALDGETATDGLPDELALIARRLEQAAALLATPVPRASLEPAVLAALRRPAPWRGRRFVRWFVTPHSLTFRVRPVWSLAFAAALALLTFFPAGPRGPDIGEHEGLAQFVGRFPGARSVYVVGSFNDWRAGSLALEEVDHDGIWRATVVLPTGAYEYMFVVDGERWVPDRLADRLVADDFGRENSVVIVRPARR